MGDMTSAAPPSLRRNTIVMATGTATSRVLGMVRNALLVAAIGVTAGAANAMDVGQRIPNVAFSILLSGVLNAVLVPQIVRAFAKPGGKRTVDRIVTLGGMLMLVSTLVLTAASAVVVHVFTPGWSPELRGLATAFALWCIPQLFFYGMYSLLGQVLNARDRYGPYMWAPVVNNIIAITGLVIFLLLFGPYPGSGPTSDAVLVGHWTDGKIAVLAGFATLGIAGQAAVLVVPMLRSGYRWHFQWSGPKGELEGVRKVVGWALAAVLVEQVGVAWCASIAANAGAVTDGVAGVAANSAYTAALLIYLVPHSLVSVSIVTALFTGMSRLAAAADTPGLRRELSRGLRTIAVFSIFSTAALIALAPAVVRAALPTATAVEVVAVSRVLVAMAFGLVPLGAMILIKAAYFAFQDGRSLFIIHLPMTIALVGIALAGQALLDPSWWVVAIGGAMATSNLIAMALRLGGLRRRLGGLDGRRVARTHVLAVLAVLPALVLGWGLLRLAPDVAAQGARSVGLAVALCLGIGTVMLVAYAAGLWLLRVPEGRDAIGPLLRRLSSRVR